MGLRNTATRWGWLAKLLHWVMALLIFGLLGVGTYMTSLDLGLVCDPVDRMADGQRFSVQ